MRLGLQKILSAVTSMPLIPGKGKDAFNAVVLAGRAGLPEGQLKLTQLYMPLEAGRIQDGEFGYQLRGRGWNLFERDEHIYQAGQETYELKEGALRTYRGLVVNEARNFALSWPRAIFLIGGQIYLEDSQVHDDKYLSLYFASDMQCARDAFSNREYKKRYLECASLETQQH